MKGRIATISAFSVGGGVQHNAKIPHSNRAAVGNQEI